MDIWILVIALLVIAIILFVMSMYSKDSGSVEEQLSEFSVQQSQELYSVKSRISELERSKRQVDPVVPASGNYQTMPVEEQVAYPEDVEANSESISDMTREEVIRLYSQGYTMHEIAHEVKLNADVVQHVIDEYIENR